MAEYLVLTDQAVLLNQPVRFNASIPCRAGYVLHDNGFGIFTLRGPRDTCFARYEITFAGNIEIPEGGTVTPIAVAIAENGETLPSSLGVATPAAAEQAWCVTCLATVDVPRGCCLTVSLRNVAADPAETPAPTITVLNGVLRITRTA
jgi:hypothetical protein